MPRSLEGFANQSVYVGVGLQSKEFSNMWYTTRLKRDDDKSYNKSVAPCMTPEKQLLYEAFTLLRTHHCDSRRVSFSMNFITSIKKDLKTELKRSKLKNSMRDNPTTSADDIILTLSQIYQESIDKEVDQGVNPSDKLSREDVLAVASEESRGTETILTKSREPKEKIKKKVMHKNMGDNLWEIGVGMFAKKDTLTIRAEAEETRILKSDVRNFILADIHTSTFGTDVDEKGYTHL